MKLCAIFICWNDWDLLRHSYKNIRPLVHGTIVVSSNMSNYGERSNIPGEWFSNLTTGQIFICEPDLKLSPQQNETNKRNYGLEIAKKQGYTHFLMMDADEFYKPEEFNKAKELFRVKPDLQGLVCQLECYFKSPTLSIGIERTLVPFIHKLTPTIKHEFNRKYPFAWDKTGIRIDPTRSLNINSGVEMCDVIMCHMSWVRKDIEVKIRNSTARANLERSTIRQDYALATDGYFCHYYQKYLKRVPNTFNLPEYGVEVQNIQPIPAADQAGSDHK